MEKTVIWEGKPPLVSTASELSVPSAHLVLLAKKFAPLCWLLNAVTEPSRSRLAKNATMGTRKRETAAPNCAKLKILPFDPINPYLINFFDLITDK